MFWKNNVEILLRNVKIIDNLPFFNAHLIHISGSGALKNHTCLIEESYYGYRCLSQMLLNNIPLVQINSPACPTCTSLLATGYGIENANCKELEVIEKKINEPFQSLENSIKAIEPLLSLLTSGLYLIADGECYPTDGNGNFFWNTPNELTENLATAGHFLEDCEWIGGHPVYIYPTQNSDCYNRDRVNYYMDILKDEQQDPRAIVYNYSEFVNIVLDGHHKACASALLKKTVKSIVIMPFSGYGFHNVNKQMVPDSVYFGSIRIPYEQIPKKYLSEIPKENNKKNLNKFDIFAGIINHRKWEKEYYDSVNYFPTVNEYAEIIDVGLSFNKSVSESVIEDLLGNFNEENQKKMKNTLLIMKIQKDIRAKRIAIECTKKNMGDKLKREVYKLLNEFKNDKEVEDVFVDYLVNNSDIHDPIRLIVDSYWK